MTKTLTEKWREGTLERGYYYYKTKAGARIIGYQCFGLKFPYDHNHNTIDSVKEVIAPLPDCDKYIELIEKIEQLQKRLKIATKALKDIINDGDDYWDKDKAQEALTKMEGVK